MDYPKPQIGYYYAECCLLDLFKIETEDDLASVNGRIDANDECGQLMVFATLAEAVAYLADDHSPEERDAEFKRLGWSQEHEA